MHAAVQALAIVSILANAVIYGTDVFCATVQRPALANVSDQALTSVMGQVHRYADRRLAVPGVIGAVTALLTAVTAGVWGRPGATIAAAAATICLFAWLAVYAKISAPVNKQLTAAAIQGTTPDNARALQRTWDSVIDPRVALQLIALVALCCTLIAA
jgi:hypothetical protein